MMFIAFEEDEVTLNVAAIESVRALKPADFDRNGRLAGQGPYAEDVEQFKVRIDLKSGRHHFLKMPYVDVMERLIVAWSVAP